MGTEVDGKAKVGMTGVEIGCEGALTALLLALPGTRSNRLAEGVGWDCAGGGRGGDEVEAEGCAAGIFNLIFPLEGLVYSASP